MEGVSPKRAKALSTSATRVGRRSIAALALVLIFLAGALPFIITDKGNGTNRSDQDEYHLPVIREFASQWPHPSLRDYDAAMTPAYHLLMAGIYRITWSVRDLRLVNAFLTAGLLATIALSVASAAGPTAGTVFCLPFLCSQYIFTSGLWLVPHNPAWWCVLLVLIVSLRKRVGPMIYICGGLFLLASVLFRQIDLWAAAPLYAAAWLGDAKLVDNSAPPRLEQAPLRNCRWPRLAWMALWSLPAIVAVAFFVLLWHGTVPPMQRKNVVGGNAAVPALFFALTGIYTIFFGTAFPWRSAFASPQRRQSVRAMILGLLIGLVAGAVPKTSYSQTEGRWGGLWHAVPHLPVIHNRSIVIVGLAALGGSLLALWMINLPRRPRWIILAAVATFIAANSAASQAWQRYDDPFLLMILPLMVVRFPKAGAERNCRRLAGPLLLAAILAATTAITLR